MAPLPKGVGLFYCLHGAHGIDIILAHQTDRATKMARMAQVNKAIKAEFPELDIEVVKGRGYFYFSGSDGFDMVDSVFSPPNATSTEDAIALAIDAIRAAHDR